MAELARQVQVLAVRAARAHLGHHTSLFAVPAVVAGFEHVNKQMLGLLWECGGRLFGDVSRCTRGEKSGKKGGQLRGTAGFMAATLETLGDNGR